MSQNAVDLLIHSRPLWHNVDPQSVPVSVKIVYGVMGKRGNRWENILSSTDDLHTARRTMDAANLASVFDRIVITKGRRVNDTPAQHWETIECAVPHHRMVTGDNFGDLLHKLQKKTANINPERISVATPITATKETQTTALILACLLAGWNSSPIMLVTVAVLAFAECAFLSSEKPIAATRLKTIHTARNWFYAILNGALLLPLVFHVFG